MINRRCVFNCHRVTVRLTDVDLRMGMEIEKNRLYENFIFGEFTVVSFFPVPDVSDRKGSLICVSSHPIITRLKYIYEIGVIKLYRRHTDVTLRSVNDFFFFFTFLCVSLQFACTLYK